MGRSLLTDEIIERANRGEIFYDDNYLEDEETKVIRTDQYDTLTSYDPYEEYEDSRGVLDKWKERKKDDQHVYKSRIENAKRSKFQRKLNLIMFVVVILLIALFFAVFNL